MASNTDDSTLIVLSAPSVKNKYYSGMFTQIIDYMANFVRLVHGKDDVVVLVDAATRPYFDGKMVDRFLIDANVEDIWIRDFAPVLPSRGVKFTFQPKYLSKSVAKFIDRSFETWLASLGLPHPMKSNLILDGGNVVDNAAGTRVIITSRVLTDNPHLTRDELHDQLKRVLGADHLAIVEEIPGDSTGHSDGMVMWPTNDKVLLVQAPEPQRTAIRQELARSLPGVNVVEVPDYSLNETWKGFVSARNVFVNSIVTDRYIYMPTFASPHDAEMLSLIQSHTDKQVVPIPAENVCCMGGSVRCLTWQVKGELKQKILDLTKAG